MSASEDTSMGAKAMRFSPIRKALRAGAVMTGLLLGAQGSWALCKFPYPQLPPGPSSFPAPPGPYVVNWDMGVVYVAADLPVGSVIKTARTTSPLGIFWQYRCENYSTGYAVIAQGSAPVPGMSNVYPTNIPGIGYRVTRNGRVFPFSTSWNGGSGQGGTIDIWAGNGDFTFELIKTSQSTGNGALSAGDYTREYGDGDGPSISNVTCRVLPNGIRILTASCTVAPNSRNVAVPLGSVALKKFIGVGSTAGDKPFNIELNCSGAQVAHTVYLRMDAPADPSNQAGVLQIAQGAGAATGVGIQVTDSASRPVTYGENIQVGPSKEGSYTLAYTARYYQTAGAVSPGTANGAATFTLAYK
mgnify:CR=1 FL=1